MLGQHHGAHQAIFFHSMTFPPYAGFAPQESACHFRLHVNAVVERRLSMQVQASPNSHPHRTRLSLMTKGVTHSKALRRHVDRSLNTALGRFNRRTRDVAVWLEDVNGPRGGIDMRCRIDVRLNPRGRVSVNAQASDEYAAVAKATNRARILLDRRYTKARTRRRSQRSIRNSERSGLKHDPSNLT
jgi:putative sigma-54 modulation protein